MYRSLNKKIIITEINKDVYYHAYLMRNNRSISLGEYVFVQQNYKDKGKYFEDYITQSVVSILTGPFYLLFRVLVYLIKSAF